MFHEESLKSMKGRVVTLKYPLQITYDLILEIIECENIYFGSLFSSSKTDIKRTAFC